MTSKSSLRTICILGGTGFVGREIASRLVQKGNSVRIPTRNRQRARNLLVLPGIEIINADVHDESALRDIVSGADAVINLIGILNEKGRDGREFYRTHVQLVEKLITACQDNNIPLRLQMSALKANAETGPSHYLRSKGAAEQALKNLCGDELSWIIFQPSAIFGPDDSFINRFAQMLRLSPFLPLARPYTRFAPVYVVDVANAVCCALENHAAYNRTYQLYGPEEYSLQEIVAEIAQILKLKRRIIPLPDRLSKIQAWFLDYAVPGKIFTIDNYRSMAVSSIGTENGLTTLGLIPTSMSTIMPYYLAHQDNQKRLALLRQRNGR